MIASDVITTEASYTAQAEAAKPRATGAASANLTSNDFLKLLMQQLQYQDPLDPVDNKEFISQQAQFTQLSTTQEMNSNIANNNGASQAASLVGESVTLTDPSDTTRTITGTVTSATISGKNSTILVNGKSYPLSSIKTVNTPVSTATPTDTTSWGESLIQELKELPSALASGLKTLVSGLNPDENTEESTPST